MFTRKKQSPQQTLLEKGVIYSERLQIQVQTLNGE